MGNLRRTAAAVGVTALIASAGASPVGASQPARSGGLQRGVRYVAAKSDAQRIELFVVDQRDDGGARLVMSVSVQCEGEDGAVHGDNLLRGTVDADGRIAAKGRVSREEFEDLNVSGPVKISGRLGADGAVTGTVDVELKANFEAGDSCAATNQPWRSAPVADPGVARVLGRVPVRRSIVDAGYGLAATEDALYPLTRRGRRTRLHRLDRATGEIEWSVDVAGAKGHTTVVAGADLVWVTNVTGDDGRVVAAFDPDDGDRVGEAPGYDIAFGPDGVGWSIDEESRLHRVEGRRPKVTGTFEIPGELTKAVAAGTDGVYVLHSDGSGFDAAIARIDPESGEVAATAADELSGSELLVTDGSVWITGHGGTKRLDASTLETLGVDEEVTGLYQIAAPPGVWLAGAYSSPPREDDAFTPVVLVFDAQFDAAFSIPWINGYTAGAGDSVWLLDPAFGLLHIRAG